MLSNKAIAGSDPAYAQNASWVERVTCHRGIMDWEERIPPPSSGEEAGMLAIDYACPKCGLQSKNMEIHDTHPVTHQPYQPTDQELTILAERLQDEPHGDLFATKFYYCPVCDRTYTRFELRRVTFEGPPDEYRSKHDWKPFVGQ